MDFQQGLVTVISVFISLLLFYLLKSYWPKYFATKGANQATREDIGEITEIVEKIKSNLVQQNELLKAQLSFRNQHKLNLKNAEREALVDYNKKVSAWLYSLVRFTFTKYNLNNYKELDFVVSEFAKRHYECDLAEAHLSLFTQEQLFNGLIRDLTIGIIELEHVVEKARHDVYFAFSKCELELEATKDNHEKALIRDGNRKELSSIRDAYRKDIAEEYTKVNSIHFKLIRHINARLKILDEEEG